MKRIGHNLAVKLVLSVVAVFLAVSFAFAQENLYDMGVHAYLEKDYGASIKYLREFVEKEPDPYAYYLLGYASYEMKNYPESREYFKQAYVLDPSISPASVKEFLKRKN